MKLGAAIASIAVLPFVFCSENNLVPLPGDGTFCIGVPRDQSATCEAKVPKDGGFLKGFMENQRPPYFAGETIPLLCSRRVEGTLWYLTTDGCFVVIDQMYTATGAALRGEVDDLDCTDDARFTVKQEEYEGSIPVWRLERKTIS